MINNPDSKYSFPVWYPQFQHDTVRATILNLPEDIIQYLENDAFVLPLEATTSTTSTDLCWSDGSPVEEDKDDEEPPTFPEFSKEIQKVLDQYGAVFVKCNWSSPLDAIWIVPTKTLKCQTLEEVYLLLKSSERILCDLNIIRNLRKNIKEIQPSLVLKQWKDINPCTEFRCFVIGNKLVAISQRDISQYHKYTESEEYDVRDDIQTFFEDRIQHKFQSNDYTLDVVRYKKGKVQIIDFGPLNEATMDKTLFTYEELIELTNQSSPEFRLIGEEVGIQPKMTMNLCVPQEINEFYQTPNNASSAIDIIQTEVQRQSLEDNETE